MKVRMKTKRKTYYLLIHLYEKYKTKLLKYLKKMKSVKKKNEKADKNQKKDLPNTKSSLQLLGI